MPDTLHYSGTFFRKKLHFLQEVLAELQKIIKANYWLDSCLAQRFQSLSQKIENLKCKAGELVPVNIAIT